MMIAYKGELVMDARLRDALGRVRSALTALEAMCGSSCDDQLVSAAYAELIEIETDLISARTIFDSHRERLAFVDPEATT